MGSLWSARRPTLRQMVDSRSSTGPRPLPCLPARAAPCMPLTGPCVPMPAFPVWPCVGPARRACPASLDCRRVPDLAGTVTRPRELLGAGQNYMLLHGFDLPVIIWSYMTYTLPPRRRGNCSLPEPCGPDRWRAPHCGTRVRQQAACPRVIDRVYGSLFDARHSAPWRSRSFSAASLRRAQTSSPPPGISTPNLTSRATSCRTERSPAAPAPYRTRRTQRISP